MVLLWLTSLKTNPCYRIMPFAIQTLGGFGSHIQVFLKQLGRLIALENGESHPQLQCRGNAASELIFVQFVLFCLKRNK